MPALAPSRIAAAVAVLLVVLLVGWNSLRSERSDRPFPAGAATDPAVDAGGSAGPGSSQGPATLQIGGRSAAIVVDVSGAVRRPGVYRFEDGQRVIDAIHRAGGATRDAFAAGINRAALLSDGQQVVVPFSSAAVQPTAAGAAPVPGSPVVPGEGGPPISLGTATAADLDRIEGIGPVTAAAILEFRDSQGGISSIDELDQVSGIGPVTMEALRSQLQP
jgi:competence protein ComEA